MDEERERAEVEADDHLYDAGFSGEQLRHIKAAIRAMVTLIGLEGADHRTVDGDDEREVRGY